MKTKHCANCGRSVLYVALTGPESGGWDWCAQCRECYGCCRCKRVQKTLWDEEEDR